MSSSNSSPALPFRSKKPLKPTQKSKDLIPEGIDPMSMKTPEKPLQLPRRTRNRNVALSLMEVRKAAERLREPRDQIRDRTDQIVSARRKIVDFPELGDASSAKPQSRSSSRNKLPEKYEILCEFFNSLHNSIRLLRLKGSSPSFTNICPKIECFTDRRFTYSHLAQLKFFLPEVIELKRTLVLDERTSCMKPDLYITMNIDALDDCGKLKSESGNTLLRRVFRSRLIEFTKTHPEDQEIPEEALPEPFNIRKQSIQADPKVNASLLPKKSPKPESQQPIVASHFSRTFQRCFSKKKPVGDEVENAVENSTKLSDLPAACSVEEPSSECVVESVNATPRKELFTHKKEEASPSIHNTPAKLVLTPAKLMAATPGLCPPKRSYMSPESDSFSSPNKLVRRPPRTRSLKFDSPVKSSKVGLEEHDVNYGSIDEEMLDILPKNLLQSIKEKEMIAMEERDPAISQAKRRRHMIACLPKIFNMIHYMFQSMSRCVITKEELIHKIISGHSDIIDRREVEEQLNLLVELVPDWISEKLGSGGDLLLRINKMTSPEAIRSCLAEAE